jgi:hypothetical protein
MASTLETVDKKTGSLGSTEMIHSEITKIVAGLYHYMQMLPAEKKNEKEIIDSLRSDLVAIRFFLDNHFTYKA